MATRQRGELPKDLAQARSRFEAWRERRQGGRRLPQPLWDLAVQLALHTCPKDTITAIFHWRPVKSSLSAPSWTSTAHKPP